MNASGQVVGTAGGFPKIGGALEYGQRAFLWTPATPNGTTGSSVELGTLPQDWYPFVSSNSEACGINRKGVIVGTSNDRAFIYRQGRMEDLNDFLPPNSDWVLNRAEAISDKGMIVGMGLKANRYSGFVLRPTIPVDDYVPQPRPPWSWTLTPALDPKLRHLAIVWQAFLSVRDGPLGVGIPPAGGTPEPIGLGGESLPLGALARHLSADAREVLVSLAASELGASLLDLRSRRELQGAALEAAARAIDHMLHDLRSKPT